ncbi:1732_t:CDS:10 [Entrophospora sp. SA101]|nr:1732_t:CDS:10 [Entrophospora sp. SA101]
MNVSNLPEPNIIIGQNTIDQNITDPNVIDQNTTDSNSRAFHFTCLVPPLDIDNTPQGNWYCRVCHAEENPPSGPQGLFQELIEKARSSNPKSFSLPENLRNTFEGVGTGQYGEYNGELKEYDYCEFRKDEYGQWKKCYICERGPCQIQPMISCDYCSLSWHFDCLDPPMVIRPPISKKWMCPAHADHTLPPIRKFKSDKNLPFSDNTIVQLPQKNLVECDPEFFLNDRKHRVPKYEMREIEKYRKDARYKKYVYNVDKILQSFDREVNEWADFISFLTRLLKSLKDFPQFPVIPRKLVVGKRLAQSLNPALPPGVHQKALEVYDYIFDSIGVEQLEEDLPIYSQGLFPFFQYATMSVKPQLLGLYEKYFFPIKKGLRPVMKAFITALLPGLEEEGSEFFEKCMWLVLITSPSLRIPALNFLNLRMPKIITKEDLAVVLCDDVGIMVQAFSATLNDSHNLVPRALLQLLVVSFPLKIVKQNELVMLMKTAATVVLRKDMSLNKRLYAWLLGPDENHDQQIKHFHEYGKSALIIAMRELFFEKTNDLLTAQKPYKILISLMDKWEIGQPIIQELLIEILQSLKIKVENSSFGQELLQTANMFLEMIDPYLIWMKLYNSIDDGFSADGLDTSGLELVNFVLNSFKMHEEEVDQNISNSTKFIEIIPQIEPALQLALDLLVKIPINVFSVRGRESKKEILGTIKKSNNSISLDSLNPIDETIEKQIGFDSSIGMDPLKYIGDYYSCESENKDVVGIRGRHLVEELLKAIQGFLNNLISCLLTEKQCNDVFDYSGKFIIIMDHSCGLLRNVAAQLHSVRYDVAEYEELRYKFFCDGCISSLIKCCYIVKNFNIIDSALSTLLDIMVDKRLISTKLIDNKQQIRQIVDTLWSFLAPQYEILHLRTVQLIWKLKDISNANHVEAVISEYLIHKDAATRVSNYERFGLFWDLSKDFDSNDISFTQPMFLMLDTLRDENPTNKRAGETWMRYNHKAYYRILQPMIAIFCDSSILRRRAEVLIDGEVYETLHYQRPFNQAQIDYVFETLLSMCHVGGKSFLKAIQKTVDKVDIFSKCSWLPENIPSLTYSEMFIRTALIFIETELPDSLISSMSILNDSIHVHATEFLHLLICSYEYVDNDLLYMVHEGILRKLLYCISIKQLDLQSRLLHLVLTSVITISSFDENVISGSSSSTSNSIPYIIQLSGYEDSEATKNSTNNKGLINLRKEGSSQFFVKVLLNAISKLSNRPLLQEWMDFIQMSLPYFRQSFNIILVPLIRSLCEQLSKWKTDTQNHYTIIAHIGKPTPVECKTSHHDSATSDWDIITLLNGFEKIVIFCLQDKMLAEVDGSSSSAKTYEGLTGYVTGVFSMDMGPSEPTTTEPKPRDYILSFFYPSISSIILDIWSIFNNNYFSNNQSRVRTNPFNISFTYMGEKVKSRIKKLLEQLYRNAHAELVEAFVELWYVDNPNISILGQEDIGKLNNNVIEILNIIPGSSPVKIMTTLLVIARGKSQSIQSTQRTKKVGSDIMIIRFLEFYSSTVGIDSLIEICPQCMTYTKEYFTNGTMFKYIFPSLLRFLHEISDKLTNAIHFEDKKVRRDMQDIYQRVLDYCILVAGRSFDQGIWLRKSIPQNGEFITTIDATDEKEIESNTRSDTPQPDDKKFSWKSKEEFIIDQINVYLSTVVIPNIRRLFADQDRITSILTNLMYYVITPNIKNRQISGNENIILDILSEISQIPFAYRVWRREAWDVFLDNRFFNMTSGASKKWRVILQTIMISEKERFTEVIGRVSTSSANTLFVSKEQESLNRALSLRRISFVIFCGAIDQYLPQLPSILEKLVDLFKLPMTELVHIEIYLCLRILLCRFSKRHLSNFWPILLTELVKLFGIFIQNENPERPEAVNVFLSAFNVINHALEWSPYALMDKLGDHLSGQTVDLSGLRAGVPLAPIPDSLNQESKRPMLTLKSINNVRQLESFIRNISLYVYQCTYTLSQPDIPYIENLLESDLLESDGNESSSSGSNSVEATV